MINDPQWYSVLPPIIAIILAIKTKQVIPSLFAGIWIGATLLSDFNPLLGLASGFDTVINVFSDAGDTRVLIFTLLIGALITTIEKSGGVSGFVAYLENRKWVHTGFRAQILAWMTGIVIFIESNITLLVAGSVSRPLFDRYKISREKLAYLIDATSAPVCVMVPLNAWTAVIIGLIASTGMENAFGIFIQSIPYNLYAITAIILAIIVIWRNINLGPMATAEARTLSGQISWNDNQAKDTVNNQKNTDEASAIFMVIPILTMTLAMPTFLYLTGDGDIMKGNGSTAIFWSICAALFVCWCMLLFKKKSNISNLMGFFMEGAGSLLPIAIILLLALALGDVAKLLGTGPYVAELAGANVPHIFLAPLVFLISGFIAFSVGSSWGTFAIMIPIALSIATTLDLSAPMLLGAALSGGVFGDHASPISDTTVVASMAAGTDHIEHVRTQLPYALIAGLLSIIGFILLGSIQ
ncbi:MAG: Na+/H+ antiporter NhaC family protein [Woeseiaceae bacterium]|nr:Na+/H+ antiporter NhaC family protein [Woeseiaceae bacterium]MDG1713752.1 Na+/H+ antiporter NhaC family protein [Woeseiaceae bacterium]